MNKLLTASITFVLSWAVSSLAFAKTLDITALDDSGIKVLGGYEKTPENFTLDSWDIKLPPYDSVVYFSTDGKDRLHGAANRIFAWPAEKLGNLVEDGYKPDSTASNPSRKGLIAQFKLKDGRYLIVHGLAGPKTMSYLQIDDNNGLDLILSNFGTATTSGDIPILAWAMANTPHEAFEKIYKQAAAEKPLEGRFKLRKDKVYPEPFEYLGWASWEQYRRNISSDLLVDAIKKIEASSVPVRWVLVDDGHQDQTGSRMPDSQLLSFNPNKKTFKNGFEPLMKLKSDKIRWISIWHAMNGHWQGLHVDHTEKALDNHLFESEQKKGVLIPKNTPEASHAFYDTMIGRTVDQGFDFVKIDNQNRVLPFYFGTENPVEAVARNAQSLEQSVHNLSQGLINCFALDLLTVFNTRYSNVSRVSVDYLLNDQAKAKSHLYQSYQNTLWAGQVVWPDHDMFHSSDRVSGRMMAVSKAVSGAPVYLSDAPADFVPELIDPLSFHDGRLLRPIAPSSPMVESAGLDALNVAEAYKTIAPLANGSATIIAYNLVHPTPKNAVRASIKPQDYLEADLMIQDEKKDWMLTEEGLVYYDWYEKAGGKLNESFDFELKGFSDKLIQLSPIQKGWAVIGRSDKYLSAATISEIEYDKENLVFTLVESGPVVVYHKKKPVSNQGFKVDQLDTHLWEIQAPHSSEAVTINLKL
ncbi:raffinose synthase Sip1-like protein [Marinimicrobium koreense]|uniref:Raffinose synthase Sip1-like protein n=1 Tax=Marinimicrobium koreense TaxID=306545 RepID=A0A3N1P2G7_9GAMM|nr:Sip1-related alpha-galactosidase [Marinimicrobium koreense]ROQ21711.1 raffinose synthase Sip1-like protein [Marinimicrobium koreense]